MINYGLLGQGLHRTIAMIKLGGHLRRNSVQTPPNTSTVRGKAIITSELLLFSKFGGITTPELGRGATADGDPKRCQRT